MTEQRHAHQGNPEFHLHGPDNNQSRTKVVRITRNIVFVLLILMLFGLGKTLFTRWSYGDVLAARAEKNVLLHVLVASPSAASQAANAGSLVLPGTLLGINEARLRQTVVQRYRRHRQKR